MAGFVAGLWPGCGRVCGRIVAGLWPGCGRVCGRIVAGLWPGLWPGCGRVCDRVFGRSVRKISFAVDFVALLTFVPCRMWLKIICQLRPPLKKTRIYTHIYIYIYIYVYTVPGLAQPLRLLFLLALGSSFGPVGQKNETA
jgi:hypothetical protein